MRSFPIIRDKTKEADLIKRAESLLARIQRLHLKSLPEGISVVVDVPYQQACALSESKSGEHSVPAASCRPDEKEVVIHPFFMGQSRLPDYVIYYLMYHEALHFVVPPEGSNPHPDTFVEHEKTCPGRSKAIKWLSKKGFPVPTW